MSRRFVLSIRPTEDRKLTRQDTIERWRIARESVLSGGGDKRIAAQRDKGKLTARERIELLVDPDSFVEHQTYVQGRSDAFGLADKRFAGDGVITGSAKVAGRQIWLSSQDFTILGGSLGEMHARRIAEAQNLAIRTGCPFVSINDSGGARIQEGILALEGYGAIFRNNTIASGVIPQISVIVGPCAGGAAYSPAITDFVCMVNGVGNMYITGPEVIRTVTGEEIDQEALGGAAAHANTSGVAHLRFSDEQSCFGFLRTLLQYLPSNNREAPPLSETGDPAGRGTVGLLSIVPDDERKPYDVREVLGEILDRDSFLEIHSGFAAGISVGFGKLAGRTVGILANQPRNLAAAMNIDVSNKAARFVRFCDAFGIPIVSLVDVPGFLPGVAQEHGGIIRHGAKLLYAVAEATVPKVALIIRKAYGGAFISMCSKALGYDRVLALPFSQIAVMGAEGAANIVFRREIAESDDPEQARVDRIEEFRRTVMDPFVAAGLGYVDDVIDPTECRAEIIRSLEILARKREDRPFKKHGNIPL